MTQHLDCSVKNVVNGSRGDDDLGVEKAASVGGLGKEGGRIKLFSWSRCQSKALLQQLSTVF